MLLLAGGLTQAEPMGSAFTYQGQLYDAGDPTDGPYGFEFRLFDADAAGSQLGVTQRLNDVKIVDGHFTVQLDFGSSPFQGESRWLEIGVHDNKLEDPNEFTVLSPRQEITAAPYALYALAGTPGPKGDQGPPGPKGDKGDPGDPAQTTNSGTWTVVRIIDNTPPPFRGLLEEIAAGRRADGSLVYLNRSFEESRRINFFDIVPVSFETVRVDSSQGVLLRETLEFSVSRVELVFRPTDPADRLYTNNFMFYLNGQAINSVTSVHPGPVFFNSPDPRSISFIPLTLTGGSEYLRSYGFAFDLLGSGHDQDWLSVSGGAMQFVSAGSRGLEITFSEVELYGPMVSSVDRREMVEWLNGWLKAEGTVTQSKLEIFHNDGSTVAMVDYQDIVPASYSTSPLNAQEDNVRVNEFLTLKAGIIEAH